MAPRPPVWPALVCVLVAVSPALAQSKRPQETLRGAWYGKTPLQLAKEPGRLRYGGIVRRSGTLNHLLLEKRADRWELVVREERKPSRGAAGVLAGRQAATGATWSWGPERRIALREQGTRLRGSGFVLEHPLRSEQAKTPKLPDELRDTVIIGHRGSPTKHCENTLPALKAAVKEGATGLEIDLCMTKDGHVVLWHDSSPGGLVALIRNHGFEGGMGYMPIFPSLGNEHRRPVHELTLAELRANYGYSKRRFTLKSLDPDPEHEIPTLAEVAPFLAQAKQLRRIFLDVKLPQKKGALQARFARRVAEVVEQHGLGQKVVWMHVEANVVQTLKGATEKRYAATHDVEIVKLLPFGDPLKYSAVKAALKLGNPVASVGRPRLMLWGGWKFYRKVLEHDRKRIDEEQLGIELVAWTLNDVGELGQVLKIGVDGIVTDHPARLARLLRGRTPTRTTLKK